MSAKQQQIICGFPGSIHPSATLYPYTFILYVAMLFFFCAKYVNFSLNHLCDWWCELSVCISVCTLTSLELLLEGQIKYFDLK